MMGMRRIASAHVLEALRSMDRARVELSAAFDHCENDQLSEKLMDAARQISEARESVRKGAIEHGYTGS